MRVNHNHTVRRLPVNFPITCLWYFKNGRTCCYAPLYAPQLCVVYTLHQTRKQLCALLLILLFGLLVHFPASLSTEWLAQTQALRILYKFTLERIITCSLKLPTQPMPLLWTLLEQKAFIATSIKRCIIPCFAASTLGLIKYSFSVVVSSVGSGLCELTNQSRLGFRRAA